MDITTIFLILALALGMASWFVKSSPLSFILAISGFAISIMILSIDSDGSDSAAKSKEALYAQRIEIIEKGKDSTDPAVIKMVEDVRADIAKEEAEAVSESDTQPVPKWAVIPMIIWVSIILFSFIFYVLF